MTSYADVSVERRDRPGSICRICEDTTYGMSLIFYLQNMVEYMRERQLGGKDMEYSSVTLSGLCNEGIILLPVQKSKEQESGNREIYTIVCCC